MADSIPLTIGARFERLYAVTREGRVTIRAMAGLRGVAVALVFLAHYVSHFEPWLEPGLGVHRAARAIAELGQTGVDLFFVLSGYLIYGTLLRSAQPLRRFLWRRIVRIYPAFTCVLALYIVLALVFDPEQKLPRNAAAIGPYLLANFLLLPGMFNIPALITVAWSLSYEAFFYLFAPLFVYALGLRYRSGGMRVTAVIALTVIGAWLISIAPDYGRLLMFTAGMFLFEVMQRRHSLRTPLGLMAALGVAALLPNLPESWQYVPWRTAILWLGLTVLCLDALGWRTVTGRLLEWGPVRWLGNMSYSYYLLHGLTLKALFMGLRLMLPELADAGMWFWILLPVAFAITVLPATLLFLYVEKPYSFQRSAADAGAKRPAPAFAGL